METIRFEDLELDAKIMRAITDMGFEAASPIQGQAIPLELQGLDIIGQAQTGTGKTAAFGIPLLQKIDPKNKKPQAIILCPTRELAIQVSEEIRRLAKYMHGVKVLPIYGGQEIGRQIRSLKDGVQVIIGTPGRVMDHMRRKTVKMDQIHTVVLDEADEMLNMGFYKDVKYIIDLMKHRESLSMFSATISREVLNIGWLYQHNAAEVSVQPVEDSSPKIAQYKLLTTGRDKLADAAQIIIDEGYKRVMIFCNTKYNTGMLANQLARLNFNVDCLHGDLSQAERNRIMTRFKAGEIDVLVATDVAARGIDVSDVDAVINYDVPEENEHYTHRIGRTGRAGKQGTAITFVSPSEFRGLNNLMRDIKVEIKRETLPSPQDIVEMKRLKIKEEMQEIVENESYDGYKEFAEELLAEYTPDVALGALLRLAFRSELDQNNYPEIRSFSVDRKGTARLFLAVGKRDGYTARKLVDMLKFKCGLRDKYINDVQISDNFSFVSVPFRDAEEVVRKLNRLNRGRRPMAEIARDGENGAQEAPVRKPRRTKTEDYQAAGQTYAPAPKKPTRNVKPATPVPATPTAYAPAPAHDETVHAEPSHDQTAYDPTSSPRRKLKTKPQPHPDIPDFSKMSNEGFDWSAFMKFDEGTAWGRDENGKGKGKATKSVRKPPKKTVTAAQRVAAKGKKRK